MDEESSVQLLLNPDNKKTGVFAHNCELLEKLTNQFCLQILVV